MMELILIDNLEFAPDPSALKIIAGVREGSTAGDELPRLIEEAKKIARPLAAYRRCEVGSLDETGATIGGARFTSRLFRELMKGEPVAYPFVATAGREICRWAAEKEAGIIRHLAESIAGAALFTAMVALAERLEKDCGSPTAMMNPGSLPEWPLSEQTQLFSVLGNVSATGVVLLENLFMEPALSASGIRFPGAPGYENCQLCPKDCPLRRAPFDPELRRRMMG